MSQSTTKLVTDAIRSMNEPDAGGSERTTLSRSELEAAVRDGVREGIAEYQRDSDDGMDLRKAERESSDDSSSSGGEFGKLLVLGLVVAAVIYRRRSQRDQYDDATEY